MGVPWIGLGRWLMRHLPAWLLGRFLGIKNISNNLEIDLRSTNAARIFNLYLYPELNIFFRFTNKGPLPVMVDRVLVRVLLNSCKIEGAILRRFELQP